MGCKRSSESDVDRESASRRLDDIDDKDENDDDDDDDDLVDDNDDLVTCR